METLWLPPSEVDRNRDAVLEYEARLRQIREIGDRWSRDLQQIDPYLELVKVPGNDRILPPYRAGFWHVIRINPGAVPTLVLIVETPDGGYRDPDSSLFDELRSMDLWSDRSARERRRREDELLRARDRRKQLEHEDRVAEAMLRLKALESPGVSMSDARPWSYRTGGRRG